MAASPSLFKWEGCTPAQQIGAALWCLCSQVLHFWRVTCVSTFCLWPWRLPPDSRAKGRSGRTPPWRFFSVNVSLWFSTASWNVFLSVSLGIICVSLFADGKKRGGVKMTNREGSFYLICVWSLARVWNVCLGSSWRSLITGRRDLSDCFLPSFLSFRFPLPFFFSASLSSCSILRPVCPHTARLPYFPYDGIFLSFWLSDLF